MEIQEEGEVGNRVGHDEALQKDCPRSEFENFSHVFLVHGEDQVVKVSRTQYLRDREKSALKFLKKRSVSGVPEVVPRGAIEFEVEWGDPVTKILHHALFMRPRGVTDMQRYVRTRNDLGHLQTIRCALRQVADILYQVSTEGVVHSDVKPSNIIFKRNADGTYSSYLIDWEVAILPTMFLLEGSSARTPAFCSVAQNTGNYTPEAHWDWESFLYTALYVICGKSLPWMPSPYEPLTETITEGTVAKSKKKLWEGALQGGLKFDFWMEDAQSTATKLADDLLAVWRTKKDHGDWLVVYRGFCSVLGEAGTSLILSTEK